MKLAVLSDIHSNHHALKACLDWIDANPVDGIAFLGDYVSDCAFPQKTMELLYKTREKYRTWFVRGNREDVMIEGNIGENFGSLRYTHDYLTEKDLQFFQSLPLTSEITIDGYPLISISHGDLHNNRQNIFLDNDAMKNLVSEMRGSLHLCGHTHKSLICEKDGKMIVNPGSVGVPHDGSPKAGMAIVESVGGSWKATLLQIEYDVEEAVHEFHASGLFERAGAWARCVIATIRTGTDYKQICLDLVAKYQKLYGEEFSVDQMWEKAVDELGI